MMKGYYRTEFVERFVVSVGLLLVSRIFLSNCFIYYIIYYNSGAPINSKQ